MLTKREFADYLRFANETPETTFSELCRRHGFSVAMLKFELHKMRREGCLITLDRGKYRFISPAIWSSVVQASIRFPKLLGCMEIFALKGIMGIYLYGSWARGEASKHSDYDLLVLVRDLTQVKLGKKLPGVDVRLIGIEDVMRLLKKDPILIVPILREAVPIYGDELLNYLKSLKFSEERLLASLWEALASIELAEGLTKVTRREASSALLYPVMLRFRQYCLTRSIIEGFPGTLKQAEAIAQKCGFEKREFRELYEAFRSEQQGIERKISKRVVLKFLNLVRGLIEECIKKHKPMKIKTERLKRLRELKREFEGILRVAKKETTQRYSLTRRADK